MMSTEKQRKLSQLSRLAAFKSDVALTKLARAQAECMHTQNMLRALENQVHGGMELSTLMRAETSALFSRWAAPRQIALNTTLARQRAEAQELKKNASIEFGRSNALLHLKGV